MNAEHRFAYSLWILANSLEPSETSCSFQAHQTWSKGTNGFRLSPQTPTPGSTYIYLFIAYKGFHFHIDSLSKWELSNKALKSTNNSCRVNKWCGDGEHMLWRWIRVNSGVLWIKGVLRSHHLSVCSYICLPVCCSTRCFGARFSFHIFLLPSLSDACCLLRRGTS